MRGYSNSSYGDAFADVYDEWYGDISDVEDTVAALARLLDRSAAGTIVELGVGTGRVALPLAARVDPAVVWGIDSSAAMLDRLRDKVPPPNLRPVLGDMLDDLRTVAAPSKIGVVFVAFNTFFNLATAARQQECFRMVADRLAPRGCFVLEAFVADDPSRRGDHIEVRSMEADRVVLSVARYDGHHHVEGHFVELSSGGGVRLRPWSIRYVAPAELDEMAAAAGLALRDRWESFAREPFDADSGRHVSVYSPVRDA